MRLRSEGTRKRIEEEREEALVERTEDVSVSSFSEAVVVVFVPRREVRWSSLSSSSCCSSLISFRKGSVLDERTRVKRSGMLIVSAAVVV